MNWSHDTLKRLSRCEVCPRRCGADRANGERGLCGASLNAAVARAVPHFWEEPCVSGKNGSGAVFFCGCALRCVFCQNREISRGGAGAELLLEGLCETIYKLSKSGVHNINLVTPTQYSFQIRDALECLRLEMPVIFNCGGYESVETLKALEGLVSVYLPDFKFPSPEYSKKLCGREDYFSAALPALKEMLRQAGTALLDENGLIISGLIIRHLVLPGRTAMTKKVLDIIRVNFPKDTMLSLLGQYFPAGDAVAIKGLNRRVTKDEYERAADYMIALGFERGYTQELSSADGAYVPEFDLSGIAKDDARG